MSSAEIEMLPKNLQDLLDDARRTGETIQIVRHGDVIAHIIPAVGPAVKSTPLSEQERRASDEAIWADIEHLAEQIGNEWPEGVSAVDAVREGRNRLDEDPATRRTRTQTALEQLKQIGREISATWPKGVSALDAVRDVRREL